MLKKLENSQNYGVWCNKWHYNMQVM